MRLLLKYRTFRFTVTPPLAWIVLDRPRASNRVNLAMALEIKELVQGLTEAGDVRAAIVMGAGRAFSVGREKPPRQRGRAGDASSLTWIELRRAAQALASVEIPLIAAINGDAVDHGLELALACDLRVAARGARLGITDLSRGGLPWDGATQRLPRIIGRGRALEMLLTSRVLSAEEARSIGLVSMVVEPGGLKTAARELALGIAQASPVAARYLKEAVRDGLDVSLEQGLRLESDLNIILHGTRDRAEGIRSFLERREPHFSGE